MANSVIEGRSGIVLAARELYILLSTLEDPVLNDERFFTVFMGIDCETDHLPVGSERKNWAEYALKEKDREISEADDFWREDMLKACKELIQRFHE
jgi:hypothetical protein